jgi:TrmH family RNA methyltransferase
VEKITSRRNPILIHAKKLSSSRSYRHTHNEFICDGAKLLDEALKSEIKIKCVLTEKPYTQKLPDDVKIIELGEDMLKTISALKNPHDLLFICEIPNLGQADISKGTYILLDNIQDPGNMGTIIRTADAFSIDGILLYSDSADVYNPKTIRASMGAIFRQRTYKVDIDALCETNIAQIIGTSAESSAICISDLSLKDSVIVLGNEGQGISEELRNICTKMVTIPISKNSESLNVGVAASIIMWEAINDKK